MFTEHIEEPSPRGKETEQDMIDSYRSKSSISIKSGRKSISGSSENESEEEIVALTLFQNFLGKEDEFRSQLEKKFTQEDFGRNIELFVGFLALGTSALNVVFQYLEPEPGQIYFYFNKCDFAVCIVFLAVYILKAYIASHRLNYILSTQSILELIIAIPILILVEVEDPSNKIFLLVPISRYIRSIQSFLILSRYFKMGQTDVDRQINIVFITMLLLTYISSGIYSIAENQNRKKTDANFLQLHDSVYFVIVTLATVGYGDEIPQTEFGRVIVLFIIFLTIVLIPAQTNELLRLMQIRSRFRRNEYKSLDVQHIVICGSLDVEALTNFCQELYHPDHSGEATNVVIIQDFDPNGDMESFINQYKLSMTYLAGDPFEDLDLERSMLHSALSCILLTNKNTRDSFKQDYKNILTALAIKKYAYERNKDDVEKQNMQLCIQLIKPESKYLYYKSLNVPANHDQLIIVEEIKMNLLAKSCFAPGLIACISNLSASASTDDLNLEEEWLNEYANGMGHEIYRMQISEDNFASPLQLTFRDIADICFFEFQSLIFALEIELKDSGKSIVRLNPALFVFEDWDRFNYYLYIICEDESNAEQVQAMDIPDEQFEKYFGRPRDQSFRQTLLDGPNNAQQGDPSPMQQFDILSIDNPELMQQKTGDNFFNKKPKSERRGSSSNSMGAENAKQRQIEEFKKIEQIDEEENQSDQPKTQVFKKLEGANEQSFLNKSRILEDNLKNKKKPKKIAENANLREDALARDYDILPNNQTMTEVLLNDKHVKLSNHIVVCGFHSSIYHFILPLRAKYLMSYQQDIVIVAPHIKKEIWEGINRFPRVFIVEGSPLSHEVLREACIKKASKAVIMGYDPSISQENFSELSEELIDSKSIFIYKAIKEINPKLQVFTEIFYQSNIDFLNAKNGKNKSLGYTFSTLYAAGEVYIASTIDTLTAQSFYNPHIVTIFQQILVGKGEKKSETEDPEQEIQDMFDERLEQSNLWQIMVPEEFVNQTYEKLFKHLLERNLVALGLYRLPGATDNKKAYCYTNPDPHTQITYKDRVFVLGKEIPDDIALDVKRTNKANGDNENKNIKKILAKKQKEELAKESAQLYYGIKEIVPEVKEEKSKSPKEQSDPRSIDKQATKGSQKGNQSFKKNTTFGPRSKTAQEGQRSPPLSLKKRGGNTLNSAGKILREVKTASPSKRRNGILGPTITKHLNSSPTNATNQDNDMNYDDSQEQQITSMEFMLRTISALEDKLGSIESQITEVKRTIRHQDGVIKREVLEIKRQVTENPNEDS